MAEEGPSGRMLWRVIRVLLVERLRWDTEYEVREKIGARRTIEISGRTNFKEEEEEER